MRLNAPRARHSPRSGPVPLSASPSQNEAGPVETAAQIEEEEGSSGVPTMWAKRLDGIEKRQARIEQLLTEIAQSMKG
jgi:hypothetical protein